jgi:glycine dehydrogenase subunit 1
MLQAIFEFQSAICALTGMDVSNASLYDGAAACAEGMLMALRCNRERTKVFIAESVHPHYRSVVKQYLAGHGLTIEKIPFLPNGTLNIEDFNARIDEQTAAVLVQTPNFFGAIDQIKPISAKAKSMGALTVICGNPLSYCLCSSPKELGADIAVGDGQPFGIPMQFGGPYVGYIACRQELLRQLPGRIVGETKDSQGRRGFVLTLQAREQHIRREKATSNICTNQALSALACLVAMLWYGKEGLRKLALTNYQRAAYLKHQLAQLKNVFLLGETPCFNEFVIRCAKPMSEVLRHFRAHGIEPGLDLERFYPHLKNHLLIAVTETKSKRQLDFYSEVLEKMAT